MDALPLVLVLVLVGARIGWHFYRAREDAEDSSDAFFHAVSAFNAELFWALGISLEFGAAVTSEVVTAMTTTDDDSHGSACFLTGIEEWQLLSLYQDGLVVDGRRRISANRSFEHLTLIAPTGAGKSTRFVIPNLLELGDQDVSIVATDPAGELYEQTAGYLHQQGFTVKVVNVADPAASLHFNPLYRPDNHTDIQKIAEILVHSAYPDSSGGQRFWNDGAKTLLAVLIRCLNQEAPKYQNLHNLRHLLNHFGRDGDPVRQFVTANADKSTRVEWEGFASQEKRVVQGMVSGAKTALSPFADPNLSELTARETLHFESLRDERTALFICVPEHEIQHYAPLLTLLYTQIFSYCMNQSSGESHLPIYFLLEEAGNIGRIPNFATLMTTLRKRQCSVSIVLQDTEQLVHTYGREAARTILNGGCASRLYLPGLSPEESLGVERSLGETTIHVQESVPHEPHETPDRIRERKTGRSLMTADEVRTMDDDEGLYLYGNKRPVKLDTTPFYQNRRLRHRADVSAPPLPDPETEKQGGIPTLPLGQEPPEEPESWH